MDLITLKGIYKEILAAEKKIKDAREGLRGAYNTIYEHDGNRDFERMDIIEMKRRVREQIDRQSGADFLSDIKG